MYGLNEFLNGQADLRDIVYHHLQAVSTSFHLKFQSPSAPPSERSGRNHRDGPRTAGQIVIFDSAPVLVSTDTVHLTALAEKTLSVVTVGKDEAAARSSSACSI